MLISEQEKSYVQLTHNKTEFVCRKCPGSTPRGFLNGRNHFYKHIEKGELAMDKKELKGWASVKLGDAINNGNTVKADWLHKSLKKAMPAGEEAEEEEGSESASEDDPDMPLPYFEGDTDDEGESKETPAKGPKARPAPKPRPAAKPPPAEPAAKPPTAAAIQHATQHATVTADVLTALVAPLEGMWPSAI